MTTDYLDVLEDLLKRGLSDIEQIRRDRTAFGFGYLVAAHTKGLRRTVAEAGHVMGAYLASQED